MGLDLLPRTLDRALRELPKDAPAYEVVSRLYTVADLMEATDRAITCTYASVIAHGREQSFEDTLTDYDFLMRAKALRKIADEWQDQLDAEVA